MLSQNCGPNSLVMAKKKKATMGFFKAIKKIA